MNCILKNKMCFYVDLYQLIDQQYKKDNKKRLFQNGKQVCAKIQKGYHNGNLSAKIIQLKN